jgi:hypothetical protein
MARFLWISQKNAAVNTLQRLLIDMRIKGRRKNIRSKRSANGVSLVELVVSSILLSVVLAGVGEILSLCVYTSTKQFNLADTRIGLKRALESVKTDVKMSYAIDITSTPQELRLALPTPFVAPENDPTREEYNPLAPQNPLNGTPIGPGHQIEYMVKSDPDKPEEFLLERSSKIAGTTDEPTRQIIAKGIIGPFPIDGTSPFPNVFTYLQKHGLDPIPSTSEATLPTPTIDGVSIYLELRRPEHAELNDNRYKSTIGIRGEAFTRIPPR